MLWTSLKSSIPWITQSMGSSLAVVFCSISTVEKDRLLIVVTDEEIHRVAFSMAIKSTRSRWFSCKTLPIIVGCYWCFDLLTCLESIGGQPLDPNLNRALLILLPKIQGPEMITQFRLINLCTVLYKIITKTIVNCLRPLMEKLTKQN